MPKHKETYDAFLSHLRRGAEIVEALAKRLEDEAGLRVWLNVTDVPAWEGLRDRLLRAPVAGEGE